MAFVKESPVRKKIIDRTFVEAGARWIIDYKTTVHDEDVEQYRAQLSDYAVLFADAGLPIKTAVFFVNIGRLIEVSV